MSATAGATATRPQVGFLGIGWIGRSRMRALAGAGAADVVAAADPDRGALQAAADDVDGLRTEHSLDELLAHELDGIVIATPSALHAQQAERALRQGVAVYCQKPLARDRTETARVVAAARDADRLLGVDLCYRHTDGARALRDQMATIGELTALELVFHNAYGPDKPWFTDPALAGGGCLIDLGSHLVDLALWLTGARDAEVACARVRRDRFAVEDLAVAQLDLPGGVIARLACSWFLPAGRDCVFECTAYGTSGAVTMRNRDGSFYDFTAERLDGTQRRTLAEPGDDWGARGITEWARRLSVDPGFDSRAGDEYERLAGVLDAIYEAAR